MGEQRVRVMVGEGQTSRKGLLRFVLENEGFDVVAEASSTLELAQGLVIHRPDVVVLDDGIDASAVGMMREVLPAAKVILVWPKGVTAVGADARLEPAEVMTSLGSTVARVAGRGTVIAPPRPRNGSHGVVLVPESDAPDHPTDVVTVPPAQPESREPAELPEQPPSEHEPAGETQTLPGVTMAPSGRAPTWTYIAPRSAPTTRERARTWAFAAAAVVALLAAFALGSLLPLERTVGIRSLSGNVGNLSSPGPGGGTTTGTSTSPGTYEGVVHVQANGSIRIRASGDIRLRIDGAAHVLAQGNVMVRGDGVVNNVTATKVRVRGNGTMRITVADGHIRLRVRGSVTARGEGVVRVGGQGSFLITHRPLG